MLALTRKPKQKVHLYDRQGKLIASVVFLSRKSTGKNGQVVLGFTASEDIHIRREELGRPDTESSEPGDECGSSQVSLPLE